MSWNVENLFRPATSSGPPTQAIYDAKIDGLAATINAQQPSVASPQEIGDPAALTDLVAALGGTWHRKVSRHPDQRGIRVAWLTTLTIVDAHDIAAFPAKLPAVQVDDDGTTLAQLGRGAVAITVQAPSSGTSVQLVTTHLKSKLLTFPG